MHQSRTILDMYRNDMFPNEEVKQFSKPLWSRDQLHSHITREMTPLPPQTLRPGVQLDRCFATKMCTIGEQPGFDDIDGLYVKVHKRMCHNEARQDMDDVDNVLGRYSKCAVEEEIIVPELAPEQSAQDGRQSEEEDETERLENPAKVDTENICNRVKIDEDTNKNNSANIRRNAESECLDGVNTRESMMLDESHYVSEIFVKHSLQDDERGDPLGGFLCSIKREDGSFLHAFCTLAVDGILTNDLHVKNKNILVHLNEKQVLGSAEYDHDKVIEIFESLPMETAIKMEIYDRKSQEIKTVEFMLEGSREEVIVKEESVQLMVSPPTVNALEFQRQTKFFIHEKGKLSFTTVAKYKKDCKSHFVVRKKIDEESWCQVYSFQLEKFPSRYLCFNGTTFDLIDSNETNAPFFKRVEKKGEYFLSPTCTSGKFLYYNTAKEMFVLAPLQEVFTKEGYGLAIRKTKCRA